MANKTMAFLRMLIVYHEGLCMMCAFRLASLRHVSKRISSFLPAEIAIGVLALSSLPLP